LTIRAYAVFEGGGAKGIGHVGAVKALEDLGIQLLGVGGASAGSIVAALVASGYAADDIVSKELNLFRYFQTTPVETLGWHDWHILRLLAGNLPIITLMTWFILIPFFLSWHLFVSALPLSFVLFLFFASVPAFFLLIRVVQALWLPFGAIRPLDSQPSHGPSRLLRKLGWFDSAKAVTLLDQALRKGLQAGSHQGQGFTPPIRMRDLINANKIPLKLVVTNIGRGRLTLIDANEPDVVIADAVAASMSIPLLFPPSAIRGISDRHGEARFVDGGLLGNLPTFAFNEDRRNAARTMSSTERFPILAFTLDAQVNQAQAVEHWGLTRFAAHVLKTGIFGSQIQNAELVPGVVHIALKTGLETLDFDCSHDRAFQVREACREQARRQLQQALFDVPAQRVAALTAVQASVASILANNGQMPAQGRLRVALLAPSGSLEMDVVESVGRDRDADRIMRYAISSPAAPAAFRQRQPHFFSYADATAASLHATAQEFACLPRGIESLVAIPIFRSKDDVYAQPPPDAAGVLVFDADFSLEWLYANTALIAEIAEGSVALAPWLNV
jgi:NTE family protein